MGKVIPLHDQVTVVAATHSVEPTAVYIALRATLIRWVDEYLDNERFVQAASIVVKLIQIQRRLINYGPEALGPDPAAILVHYREIYAEHVDSLDPQADSLGDFLVSFDTIMGLQSAIIVLRELADITEDEAAMRVMRAKESVSRKLAAARSA